MWSHEDWLGQTQDSIPSLKPLAKKYDNRKKFVLGQPLSLQKASKDKALTSMSHNLQGTWVTHKEPHIWGGPMPFFAPQHYTVARVKNASTVKRHTVSPEVMQPIKESLHSKILAPSVNHQDLPYPQWISVEKSLPLAWRVAHCLDNWNGSFNWFKLKVQNKMG